MERLVPHLIFVAALVPTFMLLAAAAVSLSESGPAVELPLPVQAALFCEPCQAAEAE